MSGSEPCLLYTQDPELTRRVTGLLREVPDLTHIDDPAALRRALDRIAPALLILDSRSRDFAGVLNEVRSEWPESPSVVIGPRRSDPVVRAEAAGAFAVLDYDFEGDMLKHIVSRALEHLALTRRLSILEKRLEARAEHPAGPPEPRDTAASSPPLRHTFPPLRRFEDVTAVLQGTLEEIVRAGIVLRAGAFVHDPAAGVYRFAAGIGCSEDTGRVKLKENSPFVRWLEKHAQLVCRSELRHVSDASACLMLERTLNRLQAELVAPMLGRQGIVGWLLLGRPATGAPFAPAELRDIMILAERVATALENATLYREVARQKNLAETLLQSVPTGIAAAREDGRIFWYNEAARTILNISAEEAMGQPVEVLGSLLADRLRATIDGQAEERHKTEWFDNRSRRHLCVQTVRLMDNGNCNGAVAFIHDLTRERLLNERQRQLDRSAFWTDLAANMSHEIRNPLVAIKTFAQLLPERYEDEEFRSEFSQLVSQEVDRLNKLIEQINSFADFPEPVFERLDIGEPLEEGVKLARLRVPGGKIDIRSSLAPNLPRIKGDRRALTECFAHVVANSLEALKDKSHPKVTLNVRAIQNGNVPRGVEVTLHDNAGGISPELRDKVFSPFCTGRGGGMGLGLPIVQRTVTDHNGRVLVDSDRKGTEVRIVLPAENATAEDINETCIDS